MTIGERVKELRKYLGLSLESFGNTVGVGRSSISKIELGKNSPSDRTIMLICDKFDVNEDWLIHGEGPMLKEKPDTDDLIGQLADKYPLTDTDRRILKAFLNLSDSDRQAFLRFGQELAKLQREDEESEPWKAISPGRLVLPQMFGRPSAGLGAEIVDGSEPIEVAATPQAKKADYVLKVDGHSMEPKYKDGDQILVQSVPEVEIGQIGVFDVNGQIYIKQREPGRLHSLNPEYPDIQLDTDSVCLGLVLGLADVIK